MGRVESDLSERLEALIERARETCQSWLSCDATGGMRVVDPIDKKQVPSHYADSHLAAALILLGKRWEDSAMIDDGVRLTRTILKEWDQASSYTDFHYDFNNFALCLIEEAVVSSHSALSTMIREVVVRSIDSRHSTINWLPMRAYVNRMRYEWSGERKHLNASYKALKKVARATNEDGGIEDRLPRGSSYNLQYNVSSLGVMLYMSRHWGGVDADISKNLSFLLDRVLPDGDINYVGRGANQLFAWGPWLYLTSCTGEYKALTAALDYLEERYAGAAKKKNILLNDFEGHEKSFWWDYHYCSVYHCYFLLWAVLALEDLCSCSMNRGQGRGDDTGLKLFSGGYGGASVFRGRTIYIAESGPALCALWVKERGTIFKGGLGPCNGEFGKRYSFPETVCRNHFGLVQERSRDSSIARRLLRRSGLKYSESHDVMVRPIFCDISVRVNDNSISLEFIAHKVTASLNVPIFLWEAPSTEVEMSVDGKMLENIVVGTSRNQYGWVLVRRSRQVMGERWKITVR